MIKNIQRTSKSSTMQKNLSTTAEISTGFFGGDYAGQSATFSSVDGKLIPVPEHFCPPAMVEWGQVPGCLECIVSEDLMDKEEDTVLRRSIVNVLPEVGCGLDNLDTMSTKDDVPIDLYDEFNLSGVGIATAFIEDKKRRVECIFMMKSVSDDEEKIVRNRITINLHENNQLKSPIEISRERKTSAESSKGTIADGGGLDARTVTNLVGRDNVNNPFCDKEIFDLSRLEGSWRSSREPDVYEQSGLCWESNCEQSTFSLPANIVVRNFMLAGCLEISLIVEGEDESEPLKRLVVRVPFDDKLECYEESRLK